MGEAASVFVGGVGMCRGIGMVGCVCGVLMACTGRAPWHHATPAESWELHVSVGSGTRLAWLHHMGLPMDHVQFLGLGQSRMPLKGEPHVMEPTAWPYSLLPQAAPETPPEWQGVGPSQPSSIVQGSLPLSAESQEMHMAAKSPVQWN